MRSGIVLAFVELFCAAHIVTAFIWPIDEKVQPDETLTFTERHMFSSENGPELMEQGAAFIEMHADLQYTSLINGSQKVAVGFFALRDEYARFTDDVDMCDERYPPGSEDWLYMSNIAHFTAKFVKTKPIPDLNTTAYVWSIHIRRKLPVTQEAWHNVAVSLCPSVYSGQILSATLNGEVGFRNPYGYLPAEMYGMLPFEGARAVAMFALFCFFLFFYFLHADSRLPLHTGIVAVLFVALVEFAVWFGAYLNINETGLPYCCPFPKEIIAALILQVFREVLSRVLLLVVSLGYGIVRPRLLPVEVYAIVFMTVGYLVASIVAESAKIVFYNKKVNINADADSKAYSLPQFILDVLFLSWIYISLTSTIRILSEFRQTAKLELYSALHRTIIGFCSMFAAVTVLAVMAQSGLIVWPWEYSWLMDVLWEALNFAVLCAVAMICLPSDTSRLLTYASQLPTSEEDDLEDMDQFTLMMAEDTELEAMDETAHGEFEMARRRVSEQQQARPAAASAQAEKHRRIVEAAKRRKNDPDHFSLPDSLEDDGIDDIDDIFGDDNDRL